MKRDKQQFRMWFLGLIGFFLVGGVAAPLAWGDLTGVDADDDGWYDKIEEGLGSKPDAASSTPENIAMQDTCGDTIDNDGDGFPDDADPGCKPPVITPASPPPTGSDTYAFDSTLELSGPLNPTCTWTKKFMGTGPVVVKRDDLATEIVAMQINGSGTLTCGLVPTDISIIFEDPDVPSTGTLTPAGDALESVFGMALILDPPGNNIPLRVEVKNRIGTIPPYHTPGVPEVNPDCYAVAGLPHKHCPKPPLDHFKCYTAVFSKFKSRIVDLLDQFHWEHKVKVVRPEFFCNAVNKNRVGISDPNAHLKFYQLKTKPLPAPIPVTVTNQFGTQQLEVVKPRYLAVPTQKSYPLTGQSHGLPVGLDHFKCYKVRGSHIGKIVTLEDQFSKEEHVLVRHPELLCNPVLEKWVYNTAGVRELKAVANTPEKHLVCYRIRRPIGALNQFGEELLEINGQRSLCVPSRKYHT